MDNCVFKDRCSKYGQEVCNETCYAFVFMHGMDGDGGIWLRRNTPKKYEDFLLDTLPDGPDFKMAKAFIRKLPKVVEEGRGLYLFSKATASNKFGTGNGKTTSAITILNEFTILQTMRHIRGEIKLETNPSLFLKASDFQNIYNSQFRGSQDMQHHASSKYYSYKALMKEVPLLVLDDVAVRNCTEAFMGELYEVIDHRCVEELSTIFTSNVDLTDLAGIFGDRIASRIEGMTIAVPYSGSDRRKKKTL